MNLIDFLKEYPDKAICKVKFKEYREMVGVVYWYTQSAVVWNATGKKTKNVTNASSANIAKFESQHGHALLQIVFSELVYRHFAVDFH